MSIYQTNRAVPLGSITTLRIVSAFEHLVDGFIVWRNARATEATLNKLSDQQLADIGLHRSSITDVAEQLARR